MAPGFSYLAPPLSSSLAISGNYSKLPWTKIGLSYGGITHGQAETVEEMRALLLSQRPDLKDDLAEMSDFELLRLMVCIYKSSILVKEAELIEIEKRLDETARVLFSPVLH